MAQRPREGGERRGTREKRGRPGPPHAAGPGQHGGLDQDAVSGRFHHRFVLGRKGQEGRGGLPLEVRLMLGDVPGHQGPVSSTAKASERSPRPQTHVQLSLVRGFLRTLKAGHTGVCGEDCHHHGREVDEELEPEG